MAITDIKDTLLKKLNGKSDIINIDTLIGAKTEITGDIKAKGNTKIDGIVNGNITSDGDLIIDETSTVTGNIEAKNVIVAGKVNGNINASKQLYIKSTAYVNGEHNVGSIVVDEGSHFIGNCNIKENN